MDEFNNVMNGMPEEPNNTKSKGLIIAVIVTILVIVGASVFGIMGTKSKTEKFLGLFTDDYMFGAMEDLGEVILGEGKVTTDIALNPALINTIVGESATPISRIAVVSELTTKDMDFSGKSYLDIDSTELVSFKYAKTGEAIGFMVPDLMNENIVVKNENLKELARKLGMSEEEIAQVPDKISLEEILKLIDQDEVKNAEAEKEKFVEILKKYQGPLENVVEDLLIVENDKTIEINDTAVVTQKHSLALTEKDGYEIVKTLLVVAKDDKELYDTIKEDDEDALKDITFEEWQTEIEKSIVEMEDLIVSGDDENIVLEISAYVKGNDTMAIELSVPSEQMIFRLATLNQKDFYHTELVLNVETEEVKMILETVTSENSYEGTLSVEVNSQGVNVDMNILDYSVKYSKEANIEKLDLTNDFVLNDKTEEEINTKFEEISNNVMNYSTAIMEKAPESLKALMNSEEDYTSDWDSYSDSEEEPFAIEGPQVFILEESNDLYNKMEIGMSKSQIIAIMGEPDNSNTYDKTEYMYWDDEHLNSYSVTIEDDKVTRKKRDLYSDSYDSIQLSTELGTEIEDLNLIVSQVKDDMTLKEVEGILGDKYFENEIYDDGEVEYTWYDKQENYVSVSFEDGKVWYVGSVGDSY